MMNELIRTWISAQKFDVESDQYDALSWAVDELYDLAHKDPDRLLDIVVNILDVDSSEKVVGAIGAGVMEDVLVHNGDHCIDKIIHLSRSNLKFKQCLKFTYIDEYDVSENVYKKVQQLKEDIYRKDVD